MPPAVRPTLLRHVNMGSLTCAETHACCTHEAVSAFYINIDNNKFARELTRRDKTKNNNCPSLCTARGSNPGSSDLNSDADVTFELHPPS